MATMEISAVPAGGLAMLAWNGEPVQVVEHWGMCAKIKPLSGGGAREVSTNTPVLPYSGTESQVEISRRRDNCPTETDFTHPVRTLHALVLWTIRLRYERGIGERKRQEITRLAERNGLWSSGKPTPKYFALLDDEAEQLTRELTGHKRQAAGLCACGCGRMVSGKARTATAACRQRLSRKVRDVTVKPISASVNS